MEVAISEMHKAKDDYISQLQSPSVYQESTPKEVAPE